MSCYYSFDKGKSNYGAMTLSTMIFSITTLIIKGLFATFSITTLCHYAECRVIFIVMLNVILLTVILHIMIC
jgi:hypothetical protein